jgi:hypothetical protein
MFLCLIEFILFGKIFYVKHFNVIDILWLNMYHMTSLVWENDGVYVEC